MKKATDATTDLVRGEFEGDGGNAGEGEERVRGTIHIQVCQTGNGKENLFDCTSSEGLQIFAHRRQRAKPTDRGQLTHSHVFFPVVLSILREETRLAIWNRHLEKRGDELGTVLVGLYASFTPIGLDTIRSPNMASPPPVCPESACTSAD